MKVAVVGASGFIGSHVSGVLTRQGHQVLPVSGLRLPPVLADKAGEYIADEHTVGLIRGLLADAQVVVNAAGDPDASSRDLDGLFTANSVLPGTLARVLAAESPKRRFVHISSAVVQGRTPRLDASTTTDPFSAYSKSKILGEELVRRELPDDHVIYRPPSVHAVDRRVTRSIVRIAESPVRSVATPSTSPSPQALVENVASAIAFLATTDQPVPSTVIHPWEGVTTGDLMLALGGRRPRVIPAPVARLAVRGLQRMGTLSGSVAANVRRVELLWFGQEQDESWLHEAGWSAPVGPEGWAALRERVKAAQPASGSSRT